MEQFPNQFNGIGLKHSTELGPYTYNTIMDAHFACFFCGNIGNYTTHTGLINIREFEQ